MNSPLSQTVASTALQLQSCLKSSNYAQHYAMGGKPGQLQNQQISALEIWTNAGRDGIFWKHETFNKDGSLFLNIIETELGDIGKRKTLLFFSQTRRHFATVYSRRKCLTDREGKGERRKTCTGNIVKMTNMGMDEAGEEAM
ncbi:hypothetical protein PoB_003439200 [Plakobranchus ocellatus]|uniref:Uncharacterized protein n=1 Tax=Plakobranchus ocellatus TaxID=259542 RepID=A0AAV4ALT2_9GAST|nr:hypothetical protein PoB_003439200 [Plakobranchus ocellatus]